MAWYWKVTEGLKKGAILFADATDPRKISSLIPGTSGLVLKSAGAGAAPVYGLPADLVIASQAQGDIIYFNGTNWVRLAAGTSGKLLKTLGAAANPAWDFGILGVGTYKLARGQQTTVAASDTVVTGLATVVAVVASLESAPVLTCDRASASIGDQAGTPAAGSILVETWKPTGAGDTTPIAASTFSKKVNWIAIGT